jgi:hypothetical protein
VPTTPARVNGNGAALSIMPNGGGIDDAELMNIAHLVGAERMLAAAVAVENRQ